MCVFNLGWFWSERVTRLVAVLFIMTLLRSQHPNLLWKISTRALRKNFSYPAAVTIPHHRALSTSSDQEPTLSPKTGKNSPLNPFLQSVANYANLSKFRLSALVVVTTSAGYLCTGVPIDPLLLSTTCIGTALCAASANSFNQTIERDYDRLMNRTKQRPLPSGKLTVPQALTFAISSGAAGVGMLYAFSNPVVALLGAGNIFLYAGPYTHMKRLTEANTWVGSVVGAIPPAMGWAAATGGDLMSLDNGALCALLFLWQFPHFFALAWMHREDYRKGGFQMVPVNDPTGDRTSALIWRYSLYLAALPPVTTLAGLTSSMFLLEASAANAYLLYLAHRFSRDHSNANARRVFLCSLWYLPLLLAGYLIHNTQEQRQALSVTVPVDEEDFSSVSPLQKIRQAGKDLCVHEILFQKNPKESAVAGEGSSEPSHSALCPKVSGEKLVISVAEEAETAATEVLSVASSVNPTASSSNSQ